MLTVIDIKKANDNLICANDNLFHCVPGINPFGPLRPLPTGDAELQGEHMGRMGVKLAWWYRPSHPFSLHTAVLMRQHTIQLTS